MKNILRLPLFATSWIAFTLLNTTLIALGYLAVPLAVALKNTIMRESKIYPGKIIRAFKSKLFWIWGNEEEGIGHYGDSKWSLSRRILYSEIIRNPTNNLRFVKLLSLKIDPDLVKFLGSLGSKEDKLSKETVMSYDDNKTLFWSLTWCGLHSNIRSHFKMFGRTYRFWLGWKIYPGDMYGIPEWDHRKARAGFATQLKRID